MVSSVGKCPYRSYKNVSVITSPNAFFWMRLCEPGCTASIKQRCFVYATPVIGWLCTSWFHALHLLIGCIVTDTTLSAVALTHAEQFSEYCAGSRWDNCCCEDGEWQKATQVAELDKGREQAFYHVLVDAKDWEASWERPPVAYVAEELLQAPEVSCKKEQKTLLH